MGEFVDHHMGHQICQRDVAAFDPFFQNGTTEDPDRIGMLRLVGDGFLGQGRALVKPGNLFLGLYSFWVFFLVIVYILVEEV